MPKMTIRLLSRSGRAAVLSALVILLLCQTAACRRIPSAGEETGGSVPVSETPSPAPSTESGDPSAPSRPASLPPLSVTDGRLTDDKGKPVQLRGVSTHGICWFPEYINAGAFASVKAAGANVVRLAMYTDGPDGYVNQPEENLLRVRMGIENARALGLYVIVDWHILNDGDPNRYRDQAITFFDAVASAYGDDPCVIYEICNEPNGVDWQQVMEYAWAMIPVIRQYAPHALILVGVPNYGFDLRSAMYRPLEGENLMYTFHYYPGERTDHSVLDEALDAGLPVFVSEWGIGSGPDGRTALAEGEAFAAHLNSRGISWCAWSLCNKDEPYSLLKPVCRKLSGFTQEDYSPSGNVIINALGGD